MENKVILKIRAGSHLHGTSIEGVSDEDFIGVYLSTPDECFGLQTSEIIEENVVSKQEGSGRNDKDAIDCKYYEIRKFCNLALNANPSIIELLFANEENIVYCDEFGKALLDNKHIFLSKKIKHSFLGYAFSQKQKSQVKSGNLRELIDARDMLIKYIKQEEHNGRKMLYDFVIFSHSVLDEYIDRSFKSNIHLEKNTYIKCKVGAESSYVQIADLKFTNQKVKDVVAKIEDRLNKASHRADGMLSAGLDYKFICHTVRLLKQGVELLTTNKITFPLKDRDMLLGIKTGKTKPTDVMDMIDEMESEVEQVYEGCTLPHKPDFKEANNLVISIYKKYLGII